MFSPKSSFRWLAKQGSSGLILSSLLKDLSKVLNLAKYGGVWRAGQVAGSLPHPHDAGGFGKCRVAPRTSRARAAAREGCALLQGLATCGVCGRRLAGYYCTGTGQLVEGRGTRPERVGGAGIDAAVAEAFLAALQPAALQACLAAARQLEDGHDAALAQWRRRVEQARYEAGPR